MKHCRSRRSAQREEKVISSPNNFSSTGEQENESTTFWLILFHWKKKKKNKQIFDTFEFSGIMQNLHWQLSGEASERGHLPELHHSRLSAKDGCGNGAKQGLGITVLWDPEPELKALLQSCAPRGHTPCMTQPATRACAYELGQAIITCIWLYTHCCGWGHIIRAAQTTTCPEL